MEIATIKMGKNCRIKKDPRKEGKKMVELTETLKVTSVYDQINGSFILTSEEIKKILDFATLQGLRIKDLKEKNDQLYEYILLNFRKKIKDFLSQEDNREKIKKEKNDLFLNFSKKIAPYYEGSDTPYSDCYMGALKECPTTWALLHMLEAKLVSPTDITAIFVEFSLLEKEEQFKLDRLVMKFVKEKLSLKPYEAD